MSDSQGRIVGRGCTPPVMITDDHKSVVKTAPHIPPTEEDVPPTQSSIGPKRNKRRHVKEEEGEREREARAKRRGTKESTPTASSPVTQQQSQQQQQLFFPQQYHHRFVEGSPRYSQSAHATSQSPSTFTTAPSSPMISALNAPSPLSNSSTAPTTNAPTPTSGGVFLHYPITNETQMNIVPPPVPPVTNVDTYMRNEEISALAAMAAAQVHPQSPELSSPLTAVAPSVFSTLTLSYPPPQQQPPVLQPTIHRLIPASGPTHGGIEITVLGANFLPTHRCVFGDTVAASTQMWSDSTLVCVLPPSATPGPVVVSFDGVPMQVGGGAGVNGSNGAGDGRGVQLFNYLDNSDRALMELALQVVGLKMTGRIEEAKDVAMRIVGTSSPSGNGDSSMTSSSNGMMMLNGSLSSSGGRDVVHTALHGGNSDAGPSTRDFQSVIIEFLKLLDVSVPSPSQVTLSEAISHTSPSGQTLLHLASLLGFHRLLKDLISRGIDLDVRDANGYTALHFAALCGRVTCARLLVEGGADVEIVDASGKLARQVARRGDQVDVLELLEEFERRRDDMSSRHSQDADESDLESVDGEDEFVDTEGSDEWEAASPTVTCRSDPNEVPEEELSLSPPSIIDAPAMPVRGWTGPEPLPPTSDDKSYLSALSEKALLSAASTIPEKNPQSLFHRTLSQLPTPNLPALPPMPDFNLPNMPMPQWAAFPNQLQFPALHLPEIPLVFPVQMPTPSWPTSFQWTGQGVDKQQQEQQQQAFGNGMSPPSWLGFYPWWANTPTVAEKEQDPPMYTPPTPSSSIVVPSASIPSSSSSTSTITAPVPSTSTPTIQELEEDHIPSGSMTPTSNRPSTSSSLRSRLTRRQQEKERAVERYEYQVKKKQQQKNKEDRMLFFFWIPILIIVLLYGAYIGIPIVVGAVQDAVEKAGRAVTLS